VSSYRSNANFQPFSLPAGGVAHSGSSRLRIQKLDPLCKMFDFACQPKLRQHGRISWRAEGSCAFCFIKPAASLTRCSKPMMLRGPRRRLPLDTIQSLSDRQLLRCKLVAERLLLQMGITFDVYADSAGTERIFRFDLVPRTLAVMGRRRRRTWCGFWSSIATIQTRSPCASISGKRALSARHDLFGNVGAGQLPVPVRHLDPPGIAHGRLAARILPPRAHRVPLIPGSSTAP
jgi:hypothetical protein